MKKWRTTCVTSDQRVNILSTTALPPTSFFLPTNITNCRWRMTVHHRPTAKTAYLFSKVGQVSNICNPCKYCACLSSAVVCLWLLFLCIFNLGTNRHGNGLNNYVTCCDDFWDFSHWYREVNDFAFLIQNFYRSHDLCGDLLYWFKGLNTEDLIDIPFWQPLHFSCRESQDSGKSYIDCGKKQKPFKSWKLF